MIRICGDVAASKTLLVLRTVVDLETLWQHLYNTLATTDRSNSWRFPSGSLQFFQGSMMASSQILKRGNCTCPDQFTRSVRRDSSHVTNKTVFSQERSFLHRLRTCSRFSVSISISTRYSCSPRNRCASGNKFLSTKRPRLHGGHPQA